MVPDFRSTVPTYQPPDRDAWARSHAPPYRAALAGIALSSELEHKYASRARAAVALDSSTLSFDEAVKAQTRLDTVCLTVKHVLGLSEDDLVFFDPADDCFWVYPAAPSATH